MRKAPGQALSDFNIFRLIAHYWGCAELFNEWQSPEAVFKILTRVSKGMPCDITGIEDYDHLDREGGIQWPLPSTSQSNSEVLKVERQRRLSRMGSFFTRMAVPDLYLRRRERCPNQ